VTVVETLLSSRELITLCYCVEQNKELDMDNVYNREGGFERALKRVCCNLNLHAGL
jgi:hypothetical protein